MDENTLPPSMKQKYLCAFHGDGFKEFDYETSERRDWPTISYATLSAAQGCLTCSMVCKSIAYYEQLRSIPPSDLVFLWKLRGLINDLGFLAVLPKDSLISTPRMLIFDVYAHKSSTLPNGSPFSYLNTKAREHICLDPFSDASINVIRQWMNTCLNTHGHCWSLPPNEEPQLPTRVLDLGLSLDSSIHLLESHGSQGKYIALSHCWGDQTITPLLKTTNSTLEAHRRNILWEDLSNTFRDTIKLIRKLGIRYLWIDSLCILQGDTAEWLVESAKMESVYGNAHLVLAATAGRSGEHGFPTRPATHQVSVVDERDNAHNLSVRESVYPSHDDLTLRGELTIGYPLIKRAWAFQERLLGPRVLHLCDREFVWECGAGTWCECTPGEWDPTVKSITRRLNPRVNQPGELLDLWSEAVLCYTCADLTYPPDRLVAISSLAKRVQADTLGRYVAGLWENYLIHGIQWFNYYSISTPTGGHSTKLLSGGPSWSWASGGSGASYAAFQHPNSCIERAEIHAVNIELESPEAPFGRVKRGEITLTGHMFPALFEKTLAFPHRYRLYYEGVLRTESDEEFKFSYDLHFCRPLDGRDIREPAYLLWLQSSSLVKGDDVLNTTPPSPTEHPPLPQYKFLSAKAGTIIEESDPGNLEKALVLQKAGEKGMEYRRIGILAASGEKAVALRRLFRSREKESVVLI